MMNTYFPHPTVEAMFLLDEADNDVPTAMLMALIIAVKEDIRDSRYWIAVADILTVNELEN